MAHRIEDWPMRTILAVEDNREMRFPLHAIFTRDIYEAVTAITPSAASTIPRRGGIGLVICDVFLPDGNAFELRTILSRPPLLLFLSGHPELHRACTERADLLRHKTGNPAHLLPKAADMIESDRMKGGRRERTP